MPGQNDLWAWLQSLQQNQGAAQPYGAGGAPLYGTLPGGTMPGGQVLGRTATTPGQPSMGYPAMGPLGAAAAPQPAPSPLDSAAANPHGDGPPDVMSPEAMAAAIPTAGPIVAAIQAAPGGPTNDLNQNVPPWFTSSNTPMPWNAPSAPTPPGSPSAPPRPADSNAKGPLASSDGSGGIGSDARFPLKRRAGAPNLGYDSPNPRFGTVQYQTPNSSASRAPIYTALNLFGGGGQPAANPNVPAANAQPASASGPPGRQAPDMTGINFDASGNPISYYGDLQNWGYGPLQQGNIWRGSGGPRR